MIAKLRPTATQVYAFSLIGLVLGLRSFPLLPCSGGLRADHSAQR